MTDAPRPAFYALAPGGWRDYLTLLHPPYTAWHLSYVAIGAALAPDLDVPRLLVTLAAFFLAVGVGAHALDEAEGRPLGTEISRRTLLALAAVSIAAAVALGLYAAIRWDHWIAAFAGAGAFLVVAYNLELFGGAFHTDAWFALAWGGFPLLTGYFAQAEMVGGAAVAGCAFAVALSLAQRRLSTRVRTIRRRTVSVAGKIVHLDGTEEQVTPSTLIEADERALRLLAVASVTLALALVIMGLT